MILYISWKIGLFIDSMDDQHMIYHLKKWNPLPLVTLKYIDVIISQYQIYL